MDRNLFKFYIIILITFISFIIIFSDIFLNLNNLLEYTLVKVNMIKESTKVEKINIYNSTANIIIMMDDGWKTQYTIGYKYMNKKGMKGSICIIPKSVGDKAYANNAELQIMYNNGWDLLNHTYNHYDLNQINYNESVKQIKKAKEWLDKNKYNANDDILIYPYGEYNENTIKIMQDLDIISGRTTIEGFNSKIPDDLYDIKVKSINSDIFYEEVFYWIDTAIKNNYTLILLFHKLEIIADNSGMQYEPVHFYEIINYIYQNKDKLNIITYSEWLKQIEVLKKDI